MVPVLSALLGALAGLALCERINAAAQRGERIYRARHRDHSTVPPINA